MPGLFGLSNGQLPAALELLSGDNASVGNSTAITAGGQFAALLSNRATTRRAEEQSAWLAGCAAPGATACDGPDGPRNWSAWGTAFGGAQWLNADPVTGSNAAQQTIGGGAFGGDYRRRAADASGHRGRPQRLQLLGRRHRRQRSRHRRACRPLWPARLAGRLRQRRAGLQPLRRQLHPADQRHRHAGDGQVLRHFQPARRPRRDRAALRGRPLRRRGARADAVRRRAARRAVDAGRRRIERHGDRRARRVCAQLPGRSRRARCRRSSACSSMPRPS